VPAETKLPKLFFPKATSARRQIRLVPSSVIKTLVHCCPAKDNLEHPLRLALATILQYIEGLTDRQAADAIRSGIDWKVSIVFRIDRHWVSSHRIEQFRTLLITEQAESLVFEQLLIFCQQQGWLQARGRQSTDSHMYSPAFVQ